MTEPSPAPQPAPSADRKRRPARRPPHPALQLLFELNPRLFGVRPLPLKLGIYEDLLAAHPDRLQPETLKTGLALHTRSNRYLEAVASGLARHDLHGRPVEPVAPEHVHHAIVELFRRKQGTPQEAAARQRAVAQLVENIERSTLGRDGYRERFGTGPEPARSLVEEALVACGQKSARQEALRRAFTSSGQSVEAFAEMYGLDPAEVRRLVA